MTKIPVGATIAQAYRFAFRDFFRILGVMWPVMLLMWLPSLLARQQMMTLSMQMGAHDFSGLKQWWPLLLLFYLVALILMFMQIIGVAQLALDRHKGPVWFYFSLGQPVWRLIGSFLLLIAAIVIGWLAVVLGMIVIGFALGLAAKVVNNSIFGTGTTILTGLAALVLWCGYFYSLVRLTFLLTPVIAAEEEGFALARSWTLGKSNFWRMFAVLLAVFLPFLILEFVFLFEFMFKGVTFPPLHASAEQTAAYQAAINARTMEMMNAMVHYWYVTYPLFIVIMVVFYGSAVGAQCFAYRALAEGEASAPIAAD
jgi:hypothetical protein